MGIDPGFAITGYGILNYIGNHFEVIDYGVITTKPDIPHPDRLLILENNLVEIIDKYKPEAVSIEELFLTVMLKQQ